jgi:hypothetical protein
MIVSLDDNQLPLFNRLIVEPEDAIATNRGQNGDFNADRSFAKDKYRLQYSYFEIADYNTVKTLYENQFELGQFYVLKVLGGSYTINKPVFIMPSSINPRFSGKVLESYELVLIEK